MLNVKRLLGRLKGSKAKERDETAGGNVGDEGRRDGGEEETISSDEHAAVPHAHAASDVSSLSDRGAEEGDDNGPPPPDYTSNV